MRAPTPTKRSVIASSDASSTNISHPAPRSSSAISSQRTPSSNRIIPSSAPASSSPRKTSVNTGLSLRSTTTTSSSGGLVGSIRAGAKEYGNGGMGIFTPVELTKKPSSDSDRTQVTRPISANSSSGISGQRPSSVAPRRDLHTTTSQSGDARREEDTAARKFQSAWRGFLTRKQVLENLQNQIVQLSATVAAREAQLAAAHVTQMAEIDRATATLRQQATNSISKLETRLQEQELQVEFLDTELKAALKSRHSNDNGSLVATEFDVVVGIDGEEVLAGVMSWDDDETKGSEKSLGSAHSLLGGGSVGTVNSSVTGLANATTRSIWGPIGSEVQPIMPLFASSNNNNTVLLKNGLPTPVSTGDHNSSQISSASDSFYSSSSKSSTSVSTPPLDSAPLPSSASVISSTSSAPLAAVKSIWDSSTFEQDSVRDGSVARYPSRRASFGSERRGNMDFMAAREERRASFDPSIIMDEREAVATVVIEPTGPINYNQLVDKIIRINDQPASLLLQQKLKSSDPAVRDSIFEAILREPAKLMRNRFGNFLMQRCLEYGTQQQVRLIGETIRGNVLSLSCDRFGCHVVQKALDTVPETLKQALVNELLPHASSTLLHRFACHVWQRALEIKWTTCEAPSIMRAANSAVAGRWHMVAADESGSLVVQCIFERRGEEERAAVMGEVLTHAVEVSRGQWGNWVIQHVLEHGAPADRSYLLRVVARNLKEMAADQYASKVVEKAMRVAPRRELSEMVEACISCNGGRDGGRPPLLDMMNHQYANYVVQHLLQLADHNGREACARVLAPHLQTLRGSKYGQRVAALVEKVLRGRATAGTTGSSPSPPPSIVSPSSSNVSAGGATNQQAQMSNSTTCTSTSSSVAVAQQQHQMHMMAQMHYQQAMAPMIMPGGNVQPMYYQQQPPLPPSMATRI
ncbi:hypothetical protein SmJEL517_g05241 [Synchytrium microbalum]|uniref:PUM-HD domain-containing protein n=1 Tax=Synchytrium microbalum TaxID=1806994 RepID=A0A507C1F7_9FUNG|nr:uncharacterized protein SmJEL517_g05241 [Synchytrium microbalum]TPX31405.1 hypothetical protein SmJEL517_g05241 [Synchytrium microbalum]